MAKAVGIGGVFLRSANPDAIAAWYKTHLGIDMSAGAWIQAGGPTVFQPFPQDSTYFSPDRSVMLNFRVDDLDALLTQLDNSGVEYQTDESWNSEIGRFARIHDPDGNPVELWEPAGPAAL
ncbi:MAG: VOC family protein [Arenibacterium sp.]